MAGWVDRWVDRQTDGRTGKHRDRETHPEECHIGRDYKRETEMKS